MVAELSVEASSRRAVLSIRCRIWLCMSFWAMDSMRLCSRDEGCSAVPWGMPPVCSAMGASTSGWGYADCVNMLSRCVAYGWAVIYCKGFKNNAAVLWPVRGYGGPCRQRRPLCAVAD